MGEKEEGTKIGVAFHKQLQEAAFPHLFAQCLTSWARPGLQLLLKKKKKKAAAPPPISFFYSAKFTLTLLAKTFAQLMISLCTRRLAPCDFVH